MSTRGFLRKENGILHAGVRRGALIVRDSVFIGNGSCEKDCAHGIYAGPLELLGVERSRFLSTREGHHVKSRAYRIEVLGCYVEDGFEGTANYVIDAPNGGAVLLRGNRLSKGPRSGNRSTAISIGAEGVDRPTRKIRIESNVFHPRGELSHCVCHESHGNASIAKRKRPAAHRHTSGRRWTDCIRV